MGSSPPTGSKMCEFCDGLILGYGERFCSLRCATRWQAAARAVRFKWCEGCGKSFPTSGGRAVNRYCSHRCAAIVNNQARQRRGPECGYCTGVVPSTRRSFCRDECRVADARRGRLQREVNWLSGTLVVPTITDWIRDWLVRQHGDACWICGFNERHPDGRSIIQADHIDGDAGNNQSTNLRLLCPNHHALTPNYGARNMGYGRAQRRAAYGRR